MEMLKSKSIIALTVMVLGVSYLSATLDVNSTTSNQSMQETISENA